MTVSPIAGRTDLDQLLTAPADERMRSAAVSGARAARRDGVLHPVAAHGLEQSARRPQASRGSIAAGVLAGALTEWLAQDRAADQVREAVGVLTEALRTSDADSAARAATLLTDPTPLVGADADETHPGLTWLVFAICDALEARWSEGVTPDFDALAARARRRAGALGEAVLAVTMLYVQRCGEPAADQPALEAWLGQQSLVHALRRRHAADPKVETIAADLLAVAERHRVGVRDVVSAAGWLLVDMTDPVAFSAAA